MLEIMRSIFGEKITGTFSFYPFSLCHIIYMAIIFGAIIGIIILFRNKNKEFKSKFVDITVLAAFLLYIADFFIMPLSQNRIDTGKLPFHLCTLMSILCFLSRNTKSFSKFKTSFTLLGLIGALMYLVYPAGVLSGTGQYFDGISYRIIQTVLYHGLMLAQGVFAIVWGDIKFEWKTFKVDVIIVLCITLWAFLGNLAYTGVVYGKCTCSETCTETVVIYGELPNWFFVQHDPLYIFPDDIDIYFSPFIMIFAISGMCALIRFLSNLLLNKFSKQESNVEVSETLTE